MQHISVLEFPMGNEKNMNFLLIPKSQKVWEKKNLIESHQSPLNKLDNVIYSLLNNKSGLLDCIYSLILKVHLFNDYNQSGKNLFLSTF